MEKPSILNSKEQLSELNRQLKEKADKIKKKREKQKRNLSLQDVKGVA